MYGVEVFDGETARFEVELSEDDVHGQWKLNGEVLSPSAVRLIKNFCQQIFGGSIHFHLDSSQIFTDASGFRNFHMRRRKTAQCSVSY